MRDRKDIPQGTLDLLILRILTREPMARWNTITLAVARVLESG